MNKIHKTILSVSAAAIVAGVTLTPVIVNAWSDSNGGRSFYTTSEVDGGVLGDKITLNSISDGVIGNEKYFVGAQVAGSNADTWNAGSINVKDGETYTIRIYVHNNSPKKEDGMAEGVQARYSLPTTVSKSHTIIGYVSATNADPGTYWDEVTLNSNDYVYLEYVSGSARYVNKVGQFALSDQVIKNGATLGYNKMDGRIPGCFQYAGEVLIDVKVHKSVTAQLAKTVRLKGTSEWSEVVDAKVGDEVEYKIVYRNLMDTVTNVMIRDVLPNNVEYVPNSTRLRNYYHQEKEGVLLDSNNLTTSGINIGSHEYNSHSEIYFTGKVVDKTLGCGTNQLVNWASSTVNGMVTKDDASVVVVKNDESCQEKKDDDKPEPEKKPEQEPEKKPEQEPEEKPDNDEVVLVVEDKGTTATPTTPAEIVPTGAGAIASGAVGAGSIVTALGYYLSSRKKLL